MPDADPSKPETASPGTKPDMHSPEAPARDPASFPIRYLTYTRPAKLFLHALCLFAASQLLTVILGLPSLDVLTEAGSFGLPSETSAAEQLMKMFLVNLVSLMATLGWVWVTWAGARLIADAIRDARR